MPSQKRHRKGNNRTQDKRARKEKADEWLQNPRPETRDTFVTVPSNKKYNATYEAYLKYSYIYLGSKHSTRLSYLRLLETKNGRNLLKLCDARFQLASELILDILSPKK